ncbi:MAG: hypothetical protein ABI862_18435 [Ilumatobacteraceae bacterium]
MAAVLVATAISELVRRVVQRRLNDEIAALDKQVELVTAEIARLRRMVSYYEQKAVER